MNSIQLSRRRGLHSDGQSEGNAFRGELAGLQSSGDRNAREVVAEIRGMSSRLQRIASSLRGEPALIQDQSDTLEWNDPVWQQHKAKAVDAIIEARRRRDIYFDPRLFADPAWDILLSLYRAELSQSRICTTNLCADANVPATTALRWIMSMTDHGLLIRRVDPLDARRTFIELSPKASESMARFIADWPFEMVE